MIMPFGKHAGCDTSELPSSYLRWAMKTLKDCDPVLKTAIMNEYLSRVAGQERYQPPKPPSLKLPAAVSVNLALELVKAGRRALAVQYHPDRPCGDAERMTQANATADYLEQSLPKLLAGRI